MFNELTQSDNKQEIPNSGQFKLNQLKSKADNLIAKINSDAFLTPAEKQAKRYIIEAKLKQITKEMNKSKLEAETDDLFNDVNSQIDNLEKEFDQAYEEKTRPTEKSQEVNDYEIQEILKITGRYNQLALRKIELDKVSYEHLIEEDLKDLGPIQDNLSHIARKTSESYEKLRDQKSLKFDPQRIIDEIKEELDEYEKALDAMEQYKDKLAERWKSRKAAEGTSDKIAPEDEISWEDTEEELQKQRGKIQAQREKKLKREQAEPTIDKFIQSTSDRRASRDKAMEAAAKRDEQRREEMERDNKFLQITREELKQSRNHIEKNEERYVKEFAHMKRQIEIAREEGEEKREALEKENADLKEKLKLAAEKAKNQPDVQGKKPERPIGEIIEQKKLEKLVTLAEVFWREMEAEAGKSADINKYGPDKPLLFRIEAGSYIRDLITEKRLISNSEDLETVVGYVLDKVKPE